MLVCLLAGCGRIAYERGPLRGDASGFTDSASDARSNDAGRDARLDGSDRDTGVDGDLPDAEVDAALDAADADAVPDAGDDSATDAGDDATPDADAMPDAAGAEGPNRVDDDGDGFVDNGLYTDFVTHTPLDTTATLALDTITLDYSPSLGRVGVSWIDRSISGGTSGEMRLMEVDAASGSRSARRTVGHSDASTGGMATMSASWLVGYTRAGTRGIYIAGCDLSTAIPCPGTRVDDDAHPTSVSGPIGPTMTALRDSGGARVALVWTEIAASAHWLRMTIVRDGAEVAGTERDIATEVPSASPLTGGVAMVGLDAGFAVAWAVRGTAAAIRFQRYDASGAAIGSRIDLLAGGDCEIDPSMAYDTATGRVLLHYRHEPCGGGVLLPALLSLDPATGVGVGGSPPIPMIGSFHHVGADDTGAFGVLGWHEDVGLVFARYRATDLAPTGDMQALGGFNLADFGLLGLPGEPRFVYAMNIMTGTIELRTIGVASDIGPP